MSSVQRSSFIVHRFLAHHYIVSPLAKLPIRHNFEEIAVRVKEIETVMISPVHWPVGRNVTGSKEALRSTEIIRADLERVVSLAQRVFDSISDPRRQVRPLEQRQHLPATAKEHLMTAKPLCDFES